ncbi:hypothetical protein MANES_01G049390v8 [Manihot esculenta]|uniref:Uncharacterized protein n=1 Tax=Manihot esculenta TaxID=3983 RepID=A0ACB7IAJ8_MANES|nr:hypothetical protein MANES_01G049390v8 [Manihot esculenta]
MGRKKNKQKEIKSSSSSPTKALSEHSEKVMETIVKPSKPSKTINTQDKNPEDLKRWIEELSKSPEVIKALQNVASSSSSGMNSNPKAIVPVHGTTSLSQTVDSKDKSNPLMAVGLPKIQSSHGYSFYKWTIKPLFDFEIVIENGYNVINPWAVIKKYYPENWYFLPKDFSKSQEYYSSILEETDSVKIKHNFDKNDKTVGYPSKRLANPNIIYKITFKTLKKHSTSYNYFDYMDAWKNVFYIQNPTHTHSWSIYFNQSKIKITTQFPNWFLKWWQYKGTSIPIIVRKHKIKWWGSFKNTTTEMVVKQWILQRAQLPTVSYAGKLTLQGEPSFGAQKAQCQALLAASKNPEEFKLICQQMYNQLTSSEKEKLNQESSSSKESSKRSSSKKMVKKKSSRRKSKKQSSSDTESTASETSSSENPVSSYDSNEDDCYGILPAIKIKSNTDKCLNFLT